MRPGERAPGRARNVFEDLRQALEQSSPDAASSRSWAGICRMIEDRMGPARFLGWISQVTRATLEERTLTVAFASRRARGESHAQWLDVVTACARAVMQAPIRVHFVVGSPAAADAANDPPVALRSHAVARRDSVVEFLRGAANETACRALRAFLAEVRPAYGPILLHGPPGAGKTCLLDHAAELARANPRLRAVVRATAEEFTGQYAFAAQRGLLPAFQQKFRGADVLLLDDVHLLANRRATQGEFLQTFEALERDGRRLIVTSLWPGRDLPGFDRRLRVRLKSGLEVKVAPPDLEMRRAALVRWNDLRMRAVAAEALERVAVRFAGSLGQLRRIFDEVASLRTPSPGQVDDAIARVAGSMPRALTVEEIGGTVSSAFGVSLEELRGVSRARHVCRARNVGFWLARRLTGYALAEIGAWCGGRDRATVRAGLERIEQDLAGDASLRVRVEEVERAIRTGTGDTTTA